jgi:hypothetical protein
MPTIHLRSNPVCPTVRFQQADAKTQLATLCYLARRIYQTSNTTTPRAFFSQRVHEVLKFIQQLPKQDRCAALEDILSGVPTRLAEAYDDLDVNMRMAFWYRLANSQTCEPLRLILPTSDHTSECKQLLADLETCDANELVSIMWNAVQANIDQSS